MGTRPFVSKELTSKMAVYKKALLICAKNHREPALNLQVILRNRLPSQEVTVPRHKKKRKHDINIPELLKVLHHYSLDVCCLPIRFDWCTLCSGNKICLEIMNMLMKVL